MTDVLVVAPGTTLPAGDQHAPAAAFSDSVARDLAVVVAPTTGRFRPAISAGLVAAGQLLGHVTGGRGRADEVRSPIDADLRSLLVRPGQLVRRGQGLAWLQRLGEGRAWQPAGQH